MQNENLKTLLKEYDKKKLKAELDLEERKEKLYKQVPRLMQIEEELNTLAINTTKTILQDSSSSICEFKEKIEILSNEKYDILKSLNLDKSYLKPFYECTICNDTGYISDKNYKTKMCYCLKQKLLNISFNKSNMYNLEKENFNTFNENKFSDEVDISKYRFNISPRANIKNIREKSMYFIDNFDNPLTKNLFFTGGTGLRKNIYDKLYCTKTFKKR